MAEREIHYKAVKFVFNCCAKLRLDDTTLASACILYHRFFRHSTPDDYDPYLIASTAIYLATKVEEQHTRLRDIVNVCHRTMHPNSKHLELNSEFWNLRDTIASCELLMLRMLKFDVTYVHPHKYLLHYLMSLSQLIHKRVWDTNPISDMAWSVLKDSYLSDTCLNYGPEIYAVAVIHLAVQCCQIEVPLSSKAEVPWWKALYHKGTEENIVRVQNDLVEVYDIANGR